MTETEQILERAKVLPPIERAALVEGLLASFDFPSRDEIDEAWAVEVEARIDSYDRGEQNATPASDVFGQINK